MSQLHQTEEELKFMWCSTQLNPLQLSKTNTRRQNTRKRPKLLRSIYRYVQHFSVFSDFCSLFVYLEHGFVKGTLRSNKKVIVLQHPAQQSCFPASGRNLACFGLHDSLKPQPPQALQTEAIPSRKETSAHVAAEIKTQSAHRASVQT